VAAKSSTPMGIPRVTFAGMVGERIRSNIVEGVLAPGAQLNEVELAASFGVSRGPVREALQRLIQEGLLRSEPHRGVFVPVMGLEDIDDVYPRTRSPRECSGSTDHWDAASVAGIQGSGPDRPRNGGRREGR
jgi:DNA-binding GntR family transcriptional regulator